MRRSPDRLVRIERLEQRRGLDLDDLAQISTDELNAALAIMEPALASGVWTDELISRLRSEAPNVAAKIERDVGQSKPRQRW